jgi:hypothetical protein
MAPKLPSLVTLSDGMSSIVSSAKDLRGSLAEQGGKLMEKTESIGKSVLDAMNMHGVDHHGMDNLYAFQRSVLHVVPPC